MNSTIWPCHLENYQDMFNRERIAINSAEKEKLLIFLASEVAMKRKERLEIILSRRSRCH